MYRKDYAPQMEFYSLISLYNYTTYLSVYQPKIAFFFIVISLPHTESFQLSAVSN